ncbi:MAG: RHS repeat-associated core domain-containing protein, partial [Dokdonella sp.]
MSTIISSLNDRPTRTMQYDAGDRLTQTTFDKQLGPAQVDFTYDPLDNLRSYVTPFRNYTHEYDSSTWRLTRIRNPANATTYQYSYAGDAGSRGNVTTRFQAGSPANLTHNFSFDQGNRMRALAGSATETYTYDGMGRRTIIKPAGAGERGQIYSQAGQLLYEIPCLPTSRICNSRTATTLSHIYLGRHTIARVQRNVVSNVSTPTYIHTDGLGSPVAETNAAGAVIANSRSLHEPYGLLAYGPTAQGIGYTGHVRDAATTLIYMQQRYYDPIAGRFLSVDPVSADPNSGGNFNRYWYANNNPYKYIDPDGRVVTY